MSRDFRGVPFSTLPEPTAPDFTFRLRNMLSEIDAWARDQSQAMGRISRGEVPDGSGDPIAPGGIDLPDDVGAVMFIDSGPSIGTDGSVFFWDTASSLLAVGHNAPSARVHLDLSVDVSAVPNSTISGGNAAGSEWSSSSLGLLGTGAAPDASVDIDEGFPANDSDFIRSNGTPASGFSKCVFGLSDTIPLGVGTYTVTIRASKDTTGNPDPGFFIELYRADGDGEVSVDMFPSLTTSMATYTTDITISASPSLSGGTANSIAFRTVGDPKERVLIAAVTVTSGITGIDLFRWDTNSIQSGRIANDGHVGIGTGSDSLSPMLTVEPDGAAVVAQKIIGATSQSGNLLEFRTQADALLSRVKSDGTWDGPISTTSAIAVTDSAFSILDDGTPSRVAKFQCSGISNSTTRTFTFPDVSGTLPTLENNHTITNTGVWTFSNDLSNGPLIFVNPGGGVVANQGLTLFDGSGFLGEIQTALGGFTADRAWAFPDESGTIVVSSATTQYTLVLNTGSGMISSTAGVGASFRDTTTNTKRLRMILSGSVGNNTFTLTNTAARNYGFGNLSGNVVVVGDDPPAVASGALGKVDLTGQTAGIGSTNLSNTPPAGLYRVDVYAACTTASGSGAPTLDVNIAWTDVVGATNRNCVAEDGGLTAFPLPLSATGRTSASMFIQVASGNIAYTTTINAASGSPAYAIYIRVTYLG